MDSDKYGIKYMMAAGYEPRAAVELQEAFMQLSKHDNSGGLAVLFASHPPSQEQVEKNKQHVAKLKSRLRNRVEYQAGIAQIKKDEQAYKLNQDAQKDLPDKHYSKALTKVSRAIAAQGKEAHFYITKAKILRAQYQSSQALTAFKKAANLNPNYYMTILEYGLSLKAMDKQKSAKNYLLKSFIQLRTPVAAYHLGEIELKEELQNSAIEYFQFAAKTEGELSDAAKAQLQKLQDSESAGQP